MERMKRAFGFARRLWKKCGYYVSLALILCLFGASAYAIRTGPPRVPQERPMASQEPAQEPKEDAPAAAVTVERYCLPVAYAQVLNAYSPTQPVWSKTLFQWHVHNGIDLSAASGEVVVAMADGRVSGIFKDPLLGYVIELSHEGGLITRYASLMTEGLVSEGEKVARGQVIGAVGSSAASESAEDPHLHFEAYRDGEWAQVLEPLLAIMDE